MPGSGEVGALLRREGLYSSHKTAWRQPRKAGALSGMKARKRGPTGRVIDLRAKQLVSAAVSSERDPAPPGRASCSLLLATSPK